MAAGEELLVGQGALVVVVDEAAPGDLHAEKPRHARGAVTEPYSSCAKHRAAVELHHSAERPRRTGRGVSTDEPPSDLAGFDRYRCRNYAFRTMPSLLRCPDSRQTLRLMPIDTAERITGPLYPRPRSPFARPPNVLLRHDELLAYPVVRGTPILLTPEALTRGDCTFDLRDGRWAEAYHEMEFYGSEAGADPSQETINELLAIRSQFPSPEWLDAPYDAASQLDAYQYIGAVKGQRVLQLGGKGLNAIKFLLAGAEEAWLVTPVFAEVEFALKLARRTGVGDRFNGVVGIAEQIPLQDQAFNVAYVGGCLHHMVTEVAGPEIRRILANGGRFVAVEPWQTVLHKLGTRIVGKREPNPYCRPLNPGRVAPLAETFVTLEIRHHGALLRYLALGAMKVVNAPLTPKGGLRLEQLDGLLPLPERMGGSIAILATT